MIDFKPYVEVGSVYDSNVYRLSSSQQAQSLLGTSKMSDTIFRTELGANLDVNLSRQVFSFAFDLQKNDYDFFNRLNNIGKSEEATWNWRMGSHLWGKIGAGENESATGFNEIRDISKNIRTVDHQFGSAYWQFHPDWTAFISRDEYQYDNSNLNYFYLNNDSHVTEAGVLYSTSANNQLGLSYSDTNNNYNERTGFSEFLYGSKSRKQEVILNVTWNPSSRMRMSGSLSQVKVDYKDTPKSPVSGQSARLRMDYSLTGKTTINVTAYKEFSAIDDLVSSYVEVKGFTISPSWRITDKLRLTGNIGYQELDYLGSTGLFISSALSRYDRSTSYGLSLAYEPTRKSLIQLGYSGERRVSNLTGQGYDFDILNLTMRYNF